MNPAATGLVSVIVPSYRGIDRLKRLLPALAAQRDQGFEALIVIDGETDDSAAYVEGFGHPNISCIMFPENRGRVAALNAGFAAARGDVLVRCDDDLEPGPDFIARHRDAHAGAGQPVGVIGLCVNVYADTPYAEVYGRPRDERFRRQAYADPEGAWRRWGGHASISRQVWEKAGGYDPDYVRYGWEDVDYGYRLMRSGVKIVLDPGLEVAHHAAAVTTTISALRALHSGAARTIFERKHGPVLGPPLRVTSVWTALVVAASLVLTERTIRLVCPLVDRVLPRLPRRIGEKLVALLVEASSHAGHRRPTRAVASF
ncbi:MAG: glycosyltransferase family 2 protein [Propionibacteriaceae bacterium]|nr:glycosyltransferase family 2 protein [Propionibacteriaceae bacterium]